jgi:hypothetical protein
MTDTTRPVTERDFRMPEFLDAKPEDYERRADGRVVRKDRWETTVRAIASRFGVEPREGFECDTLLYWVTDFIDRAEKAGVAPCYDEELQQ